jgi:hypothetical protein
MIPSEMPGLRPFCCGLACRNNNLPDNDLYWRPSQIDRDWARSPLGQGTKALARQPVASGTVPDTGAPIPRLRSLAGFEHRISVRAEPYVLGPASETRYMNGLRCRVSEDSPA